MRLNFVKVFKWKVSGQDKYILDFKEKALYNDKKRDSQYNKDFETDEKEPFLDKSRKRKVYNINNLSL